MKKIALAALVLSLLLIPVLAAAQGPGEINMVGEWKGTGQLYDNRGFVMNRQVTFVIKEQKGQIFHGTKMYPTPEDKQGSEGVMGSVGYMGEVYIVEEKDGIALGRVLADDVIELHYLEPGRVVVYKLTKMH